MINMAYEDIIRRIKEEKDINDETLKEKIKTKMDQLSGLISKEGAAYIVANDLGVKLIQTEGLVKINNIVAGQRNIEIAGKVSRIFDLIEFQKDDRKGKVRSFILADETGQIRVTAWHDNTALLDTFQEGATLKIKNGFIKANQGQNEIHLNDKSKLTVNPTDVKIEGVKEFKKPESVRKKISELTVDDQNAEIFATIVQVYDPRYFEQCPECKKKPTISEGSYVCAEHGAITPIYGYVTNVVLDDGSDSIRAVMFKEQMQKLFNKTDEELLQFKGSIEKFESLKTDLLGEQVIIAGKVIKNEMFDRLEIRTNRVVRNVDPDKEIEKIKTEKPVETASDQTEESPAPVENKEEVIPVTTQTTEEKPTTVETDSTETDIPTPVAEETSIEKEEEITPSVTEEETNKTVEPVVEKEEPTTTTEEEKTEIKSIPDEKAEVETSATVETTDDDEDKEEEKLPSIDDL